MCVCVCVFVCGEGVVVHTCEHGYTHKLYGHVPDPFARCGMGSGHARLPTYLDEVPNAMSRACSAAWTILNGFFRVRMR